MPDVYKRQVNNLQHCLGTGEYDDSEVQIALAHAKRMVKCAQSKVSNLKQEENLQRKYEREKSAKEMQQKSEVKRRVHQKENDLKQKMATEEIPVSYTHLSVVDAIIQLTAFKSPVERYASPIIFAPIGLLPHCI